MWALIPLKPFRQAKTRLAPRLSDGMRHALARSMAEGVMRALLSAVQVDQVAVCTADGEAEMLARELGCRVLPECDPGGGLNEVVAMSAARLAEMGAERLLVVHGDLPFLNAREIDMFCAHFLVDPMRLVAMTPDRHGDGTNMIAWSLRHPFRPRFGHGSFRLHQEEARDMGLIPLTCRLPGAAADLDTAEDLAWIEAEARLRGRAGGPFPTLPARHFPGFGLQLKDAT